jgi:hypothetical protein
MYHPTLSSPVTRRIWGSSDAILLFFAGGAAEFAAIKAVDWLFFTGRLPGAPVERFFETVRFAQGVFFGDPAGATSAVERINTIHRRVEEARGEEIPQWAYRDMLFILIDYGERAHEVVFGPMTEAERASHFGVALALGRGINRSPSSFGVPAGVRLAWRTEGSGSARKDPPTHRTLWRRMTTSTSFSPS